MYFGQFKIDPKMLAQCVVSSKGVHALVLNKFDQLDGSVTNSVNSRAMQFGQQKFQGNFYTLILQKNYYFGVMKSKQKWVRLVFEYH